MYIYDFRWKEIPFYYNQPQIISVIFVHFRENIVELWVENLRHTPCPVGRTIEEDEKTNEKVNWTRSMDIFLSPLQILHSKFGVLIEYVLH
jgi:hypothetical protein